MVWTNIQRNVLIFSGVGFIQRIKMLLHPAKPEIVTSLP